MMRGIEGQRGVQGGRDGIFGRRSVPKLCLVQDGSGSRQLGLLKFPELGLPLTSVTGMTGAIHSLYYPIIIRQSIRGVYDPKIVAAIRSQY